MMMMMMIRAGPCPHISNWIGSPDHRQSNAIPSVAKTGAVCVRFVVLVVVECEKSGERTRIEGESVSGIIAQHHSSVILLTTSRLATVVTLVTSENNRTYL
jgi:hypothetical protein